MAGPRLLEMAGAERVAQLIFAANVQIVVRRKSQEIVEIQLLDYGDDSVLQSRCANDQKFSTRFEGLDNPQNVWAHKRSAVRNWAVKTCA